MTHPYIDLDDNNFWKKAVAYPASGHIDPVTEACSISKTDKVSTMGSCFAQHLSKNIAKSGYNYFVTEHASSALTDIERKNSNYGVFSARYGNIYTVKQAVQLFDRAYDSFSSDDNVWAGKNGSYVDAYRPQVEFSGFSDINSVLSDRAKHLTCVREMFEQSDLLIFTLGLTEAWQSKNDGSIFPIAPGVSGGSYDSGKHEFINFTYHEVVHDLNEFIGRIRSVNDRVKVILTVSPVPLVATYERRHVLVSTTASKAILRAAADEIERLHQDVIYFPSYEIITSPANYARYYCDDLRQVTDIGVNHVMRMFSKHFLKGSSENELGDIIDVSKSVHEIEKIVCDEEEIEAVMGASDLKSAK